MFELIQFVMIVTVTSGILDMIFEPVAAVVTVTSG